MGQKEMRGERERKKAGGGDVESSCAGREGGDRVRLHPQWQIARMEGEEERGATDPQLTKIICSGRKNAFYTLHCHCLISHHNFPNIL